MADTVNVNIVDRSVPIKNPVNIAVVNVPNPAMNVTVDADQLYDLINIPKYFITDASTGAPITGANYEDYFPSGGGGGGGGGSIIIDNFPTEGSTNAVSSGGTYSFVNSSVATNTANFIGTFNSVEDLEAYSGTVTNNDYAFVIGTDANGNTKYDRYKYTDATDPASWEYEYTLNNSSFTAEEWATIQSGLTATDKNKYDGHLTNTNNPHSVTKAQVGLSNVTNDAQVTAVTWDNTNAKITKTINGTTTDVVALDTTVTENIKKPVTSGGVYTAIKDLEVSFKSLEPEDAILMINESINKTSEAPITNDEKPYVMTYIDYTDMTNSYTSGNVNNLTCYNKRRRCNVSDNGTINAFYGDESFIEDGSNGQVMVYQPKFYYKVEPVLLDGIKIRKCNYYISDYPLEGFKLHPAFIDRTDPTDLKEFPFVCIGAYEGCLQNGSTYITDDSSPSTSYKLSSIAYTSSATAIKPTSGFTSPFGTIENFVANASNRGTGWCIENIWIASMNQLMFIIEMCNPDSQTILGNGISGIDDTPNTANNASLIGSTSPLCNNSGKAPATFSNYNSTTVVQYDADKIAVSYRGMENPYGNIWTWIDGITIQNTSTTVHVPYICKSFTYTRTSDITNYDMVNVNVPGKGYVTAFGYDSNFDWLFMAAEIGTSTDGTIHDNTYTTDSGYTCALLGGCWRHGTEAGLFYWGLNLWYGGRSRNVGARICYLPGLSNE